MGFPLFSTIALVREAEVTEDNEFFNGPMGNVKGVYPRQWAVEEV